MRIRLFASIALCLVVVSVALVHFRPMIHNTVEQDTGASESPVGRISDVRIMEAFGKLPVSFEANQGQVDSEVKFLSHGTPYSLFLTADEAVLTLNPGSLKSPDSSHSAQSAKSVDILRMQLTGANLSPRIEGADELPGKSNYFIGNDPSKWRTNVPTYAKVKYTDVYSGIDLVYYGNQQQLEYDFIVAPGANPADIRLNFAGADKIETSPEGDLRIHLGDNEVRLRQPIIYQEIAGMHHPIVGGYATMARNEVGFLVTAYDATKPLIIDPMFVFAADLLGVNLRAIVLDNNGNAFVAGERDRTDFASCHDCPPPIFGPDIFIAKIDITRPALIYATHLSAGFNTISAGSAIAIDPEGNAYVAGSSVKGFPTSAGAYQETIPVGVSGAFALKLTPSGSQIVYSTFIGNQSSSQGIAVDTAGNAYVAGSISSPTLMATSPIQAIPGGGTCDGKPCSDAFVVKINPTGTGLLYSTYLGGSSGDFGNGIAVDSAGNAYVVGAAGTNFPTTPGAFQRDLPSRGAFVAKINPEGAALIYSTYIGGRQLDSGTVANAIALDAAGYVYVTGETSAADFPLVNAFQANGDAFVAKLNPSGSSLIFSTYFGGSWAELPTGIALDGDGNVYIVGFTPSCDMPLKDSLFSEPLLPNHTILSEQDRFPSTVPPEYTQFPCPSILAMDPFLQAPFIAKFSAAGNTLLFSSFLPGGNPVGKRGLSLATDQTGDIYVVGSNGARNANTQFGPGFPFSTTLNLANSAGVDREGFLFRISLGSNPMPAITAVEAARVPGTTTQFYLLVTGSNLYAGSVVMWNGSPRPTRFATFTTLVATVSAADVAIPGPIPITVYNSPPSGGVSNTLLFSVNPAPTIQSLEPSITMARSISSSVFVQGVPFVKGATVRLNGNDAPTRTLTGGQLLGSIPAGQLSSPGQIAVTVANPPPGGGVSNALTLTVAPAPLLTAAGLVNAASFESGPSAAGSIVSLFGQGMSFTTASAGSFPLPISLGGIELRINNPVTPLFYVSPTQINFQIPWALQGQSQATLTLSTGGVTPSVSIPLAPFSPGVFAINQQGTGQGAVLMANTGILAAPIGTIPGARPVNRGAEYISIFCTGLGVVTNPPASGAVASASPTSRTMTLPTVTIGGVVATVSFSGLAPGFVGLYQVDALVPDTAPTGSAVPLSLSIGGAAANTVTIAVQ